MEQYSKENLNGMSYEKLINLQIVAEKDLRKTLNKKIKAEVDSAKATEWHREIESNLEAYNEHGCYPGYDLEYSYKDQKAALIKADKLNVKVLELERHIIVLRAIIEPIEEILNKRAALEESNAWENDPNRNINIYLDDDE